MVKKIFIFTVLFFLIIFSIQAQDTTDLQKKINEYQEKLQQLKQQKNTLSSQIQYMDTQIYLTGLQISATEQKIVETEKEINLLGSRIEGLDQSLDYLSKLLINRIVEGYKKKPFSIFSLLFDNKNANDFFNQVKYLKTAQTNNQKLLYTVQETKTNYEEQKKLREEKKIELDKLTETLNYQKQSLNNQKGQKQKLLADTQNDETTYQRLLAQAQAQLAGFKSFIKSSGANSVIATNAFGTGSDNAYYSQRDARWANQTIGGSNENILNVGCLLTSVAMVAKHYGENLTPSDIASNPDRFYGLTAYMSLPWKSVAGRSYYGGVNVDQELANGNYVIVGVGGCSYGGSHFIILTKKDGDDYIMNDPIYGPDLKLSTHYSKSFCSTATFK
jgi:peptidoglycan hydrolase CwlO-like protein